LVLFIYEWELDAEESVMINGNPDALYTGVWNIIKNGLAYGDRRIKVGVEGEESFGVVRISDDGEGVSEDIRDRMFDEGVSGYPPHTGLGLAIAHEAIVDIHDGRIDVGRGEEPYSGAEFRLYIPLIRE